MGKLVYLMNVSLDGYVETPDHSLDWTCWRHDCMGMNLLMMAALNGDVDSGCRAAR